MTGAPSTTIGSIELQAISQERSQGATKDPSECNDEVAIPVATKLVIPD